MPISKNIKKLAVTIAITIALTVFLSLFLNSTARTFAQASTDPVSTKPVDQTFNIKEYLTVPGKQSISYLENEDGGVLAFITKIINTLTQLVGVIAIIIIILSGLMMIASDGNENLLSKGKDGFKYAIIGLLLSFTGYLITIFIQAIFYA